MFSMCAIRLKKLANAKKSAHDLTEVKPYTDGLFIYGFRSPHHLLELISSQ